MFRANTTGIHSLEYPLSRPFSTLGNYPYKFVPYLVLHYVDLSLCQTIFFQSLHRILGFVSHPLSQTFSCCTKTKIFDYFCYLEFFHQSHGGSRQRISDFHRTCSILKSVFFYQGFLSGTLTTH